MHRVSIQERYLSMGIRKRPRDNHGTPAGARHIRRSRFGNPGRSQWRGNRNGDGRVAQRNDYEWSARAGPRGVVPDISRLLSLLSEPAEPTCGPYCPDQHSAASKVRSDRFIVPEEEMRNTEAVLIAIRTRCARGTRSHGRYPQKARDRTSD